MGLPIKSPSLPNRPQPAASSNQNDLLANHNNEFTVRGIWGEGVPAGMKGVMVRKEKTKETRYLLVPAIECEKFGWTKILNPDSYSEWRRK
jgi:NADH:ubiquinone oxidoreductase subunit F (NADH-binding)